MIWGSKIEPLEILLSADSLQMNLPNKADIGIHTYGATQQEGLLFRFHVYADKKQPVYVNLILWGLMRKSFFQGSMELEDT
ncbi:MAG: hypothetical protein K0S22_1006 [Oscillospiraceae bacterium]|nr:hypothetical protein [Oscillospiraceae bacterium]